MSDTSPETSRPGCLPSLVHAAVAALFAYTLSVGPAIVAAFFGAFAGVALGRRVADSRLRTWLVPGVGLLVCAAGALLDALVTETALGSVLGAGTAVVLGDVFFYGIGAVGVSLSLRALTTRRPTLVVLEVLATALVAAQVVVDHRHGAINRPFELADPLLAAGEDPVILFLAMGGVATTLVALVLIRERRPVRVVLHLGAALALLLLLVFTTKMTLPTPPPPQDGLGLRDESESQREEERRQGRGQGRGGRPRDDFDFRDQSPSRQASAPVAVVVFHDDYSPPGGFYYFRQDALSEFNGHRLVRSLRGDVDEDVARSYPSAPIELRDTAPDSDRRVELSTTIALLADHARPFGLEAPVRFAPATNPDPSRFLRAYAVTSRALRTDLPDLFELPAGSPGWSAEERTTYTRLPDDARYSELAARIIDEMLPAEYREIPVAKVAAITSWLGREGVYSLRTRHAQASDPAGEFLFGDKIGYCVHFAHAAVYLMRSLGLPARVATGYALDESWRRGGSSLIITDQSAHAWPEVYFEGVGWVVADVSPERSLDPPPQPPDQDLQQLLGELARGESPTTPDAAERPIPQAIATIRAMGHALTGAVPWLLALGVLGLYAAKVTRRIAPAFAGPDALPRAQYLADLDRLSEVGIRRARGESPEAFARRVAASLPTFTAVTSVHVASAFGSRSVRSRLAALRAEARALRAELRRSVPFWRRILGLLNPVSFFFSR